MESTETRIPPTPEQIADACARAQTLLAELLRLCGVAAPSVAASWDRENERVKAVVESQDASVLVEQGGRLLEAVQTVASLMLNRGAQAPVALQVDALSFWEKREQAVLDAARRAADSVRATGKPYRLEPMDAATRRLVHRALAGDPEVATVSEGEGPWRKIVLRPKAR